MKNNILLVLITVVSLNVTGCATATPAHTEDHAEVDKLMDRHRLQEAFREAERSPVGSYR